MLASPARVCRFYGGEAMMSLYVLGAAGYGVMFLHRMSFAVFLFLQGQLLRSPREKPLLPPPLSLIHG